MENDIFIWTEVINCGKIGKIALDSFRIHHPDVKAHVFGTPKDFEFLTPDKNNILIDMSESTSITNRFSEGHYGTASLWAWIIKTSQNYNFFIHFDSDVIFRDECLSDIINAYKEGYSLVGPIRNYKNNPNGRDDIRYLPDVTQTLFFGFDRNKIDYQNKGFELLARMCQGAANPLGHPVIDFFDPIMFEIIKNKGKVKILNQKEYGGCDDLGKRDFDPKNIHIDFGEKLVHFSAVGSGMNFFNNKVSVPEGYKTYAIEKYALFCELFYNEIIDFNYNRSKYEHLFNVKDWYGNKR